MTRNQARLMRFCLSYPGWQPIGQDTRATAATLRDWGLLEQSETAPNLFRLALADDRRRELEAAPAMLAALQQIESDWGEAMRDDSPINGGDAVQWLCEFFPQVTAAIALATGAPTGEAAGEDCQTCADACETRLLPCDECGALDSTPTDEKPARTFTAFCQQANGRGTIWIQAVEAETLEDAIHTAINDCADAWGYDAAAVHCLGLIEGEATVAHWQDLEG